MNRDNDPPSDQPRSLVQVILIVLAAGIVTAVVAIGTWVWTADRARRATLPGGTTVVLLGTTVGSERITTETQWEHLARSILPAQLQRWVPASLSMGGGYSDSNTVVVYFQVISPTRPVGGGVPWQSYEAVDDNGFIYANGGGYGTQSDGSGNLWANLALRAYPRRQRNFTLRLIDNTGAVMANLRVPNPVRGPFPEWQASPIPQTQTNGPVKLTLEHLEEAGRGPWHYLRPKWRLEANDPKWAEAKERYWTVMDATGNEGSFLARSEKVWKLQAQVFRERPQDFATNEQVVFTNLALAEPGTFTAVDQSTECAGVSIKALVLAGTGTFGISNGVTRFMLPSLGTGGNSTSSSGTNTMQTWGIPKPTVMVEAQNCRADDELKFIIHDDTGKELEVATSGYDGNGGGRTYLPSFTPSDGAKSVTVQIMVNRPLKFEFSVNPADVPAGKP